jgi:hypothetical protein
MGLAKIVGDPIHDMTIRNGGLPAASMDHYNNGNLVLSFRQPQVNFLEGVGAVFNRGSRLRMWALEKVWPSQKLGVSGNGTCDHQEQEGSDAHG